MEPRDGLGESVLKQLLHDVSRHALNLIVAVDWGDRDTVKVAEEGRRSRRFVLAYDRPGLGDEYVGPLAEDFAVVLAVRRVLIVKRLDGIVPPIAVVRVHKGRREPVSVLGASPPVGLFRVKVVVHLIGR